MVKQKVNSKNGITILWLGGVFLIQLLFLIGLYCYKKQDSELIIKKVFWSSYEGSPETRKVLDALNNRFNYQFYNNYEQLDEFIVFFYHCADAQSGKVFIDIEDSSQNIIYSYSFEPQYMKDDVFCLTGHLENRLEKEKYYNIVIRVEDMNMDDYLEIGTSTYTQNRDIFLVEGEEVLFTKLEYTALDINSIKESIWNWINFLLIIDYGSLILGLFVRKRNRIAIAVLAMTIGIMFVYQGAGYVVRKNQWYSKYNLISHAMGEIDGKSYTNSLEAFEKAYSNGHRVFEVDFSITSDKQIVLKHDWEKSHGLSKFENGYIPTYEEFMEAKIWEQYSTMGLESLFETMLEYEDIYIVTDSKDGKYSEVINEFESMNAVLHQFSDPEQTHIKEHLIIQLYNNDMYHAVESVIHFEHYIYTLYQKGINSLDDTIEFCLKNDIPVVVMPFDWWTDEINEKIHENGLKVYLHTLNDENEINSYMQSGVDGVYTDSVLPSAISR